MIISIITWYSFTEWSVVFIYTDNVNSVTPEQNYKEENGLKTEHLLDFDKS